MEESDELEENLL